VEWSRENLEVKVSTWIEQNELSVGAVLWPMRAALSGKKNSPGPFEIAGVLGRERSTLRLQKAFDVL